MRTDVMFDVCNAKLCRRLPPQRFGYIAGPNAPSRAVAEHYNMAFVMPLDLHGYLRSGWQVASYVIGNTFDQQFGRSMDVLGNFFANLRMFTICLLYKIQHHSFKVFQSTDSKRLAAQRCRSGT